MNLFNEVLEIFHFSVISTQCPTPTIRCWFAGIHWAETHLLRWTWGCRDLGQQVLSVNHVVFVVCKDETC